MFFVSGLIGHSFATLVHALDDYERTIGTDVLREPGVLLATREAGEEIQGRALGLDGGAGERAGGRGGEAGAEALQGSGLETLDQDRGVGAGQAAALQRGDEGVLHRQAEGGEIRRVFQLGRHGDGAPGPGRCVAGDGDDLVEGQDRLLTVIGGAARSKRG